jgi:type I restriction enzyme R subunit
LERPNIGLLSDSFLEEVRHLPQRNFAVELLQRLLNDEIKSRSSANAALEKKFSECLQEALNRSPSKAHRSSKN